MLKKHFRSGSRPTEEHFFALIDSCYNQGHAIFVSGYDLITEKGDHSKIKSIAYDGGKTIVVPYFKRINLPNTRSYHYSLPCPNLGAEIKIEKISLYLDLPPTETYDVKDKSGLVKINQKIVLQSIAMYSGLDLFLELDNSDLSEGPNFQIKCDEKISGHAGISVDITVDYDIESNIAVSDQFDITEENSDKLSHVFGGLGMIFQKV